MLTLRVSTDKRLFLGKVGAEKGGQERGRSIAAAHTHTQEDKKMEACWRDFPSLSQGVFVYLSLLICFYIFTLKDTDYASFSSITYSEDVPARL